MRIRWRISLAAVLSVAPNGRDATELMWFARRASNDEESHRGLHCETSHCGSKRKMASLPCMREFDPPFTKYVQNCTYCTSIEIVIIGDNLIS